MTKISDAEIADYAVAAGFPAKEIVTAIAIALAESSGEPTATHLNSDAKHSTDFGLWQINGYWNPDCFTLGDWKNPRINAAMAVKVWRRQTWTGWSTFKSGSYKKFLDRANAAYPETLGSLLQVRRLRYMRGDVVSRVQRIVGVDDDGVYGPETASAVADWQKSKGLFADGVVGPQTVPSFGWLWSGK